MEIPTLISQDEHEREDDMYDGALQIVPFYVSYNDVSNFYG